MLITVTILARFMVRVTLTNMVAYRQGKKEITTCKNILRTNLCYCM